MSNTFFYHVVTERPMSVGQQIVFDEKLRELALEEVRKRNYPAYPSRMGCLYVSNTLEDANKWFDFFTRLGRPTLQIVKVEVTGQVFEGNANRCFEGSKYRERNLKLAEAYWTNDAKSDADNNPVVEVLVPGIMS